MMYESITGTFKSEGNYSISSFSIGPSFKANSFWGDFGLTIQPRFSVNSTASISKLGKTHQIKFSETSLLVGLEKENSSKAGKFLYGYAFQRKWMKANTGDLLLEVNYTTNHDDSITFYMGHRSDWIW